MTAEAIALLLADGGPVGIAAFFIWLYLAERNENKAIQKERISDTKLSVEALYKNIDLLESARADLQRERSR